MSPNHSCDIEAAVREAILDAVRAGLGHAILLIDESGADNPDAQPHCWHLAATLRRQSALVGVGDAE